MDSAAFHQLITPQQWKEGRLPQQWRYQNYLCHVLEKKIPVCNNGPSLDSLAAGSENLASNSLSSPLALQVLVQQRRFMSSIKHVPVVQRSDYSCTSHPRFDPLKRTTKRGSRGKERSKKIISAKPTRSSHCVANWRV